MSRLSVATVCADGIQTPYLRIGRGPTVVVLRDATIEQSRSHPLVGELAPDFRVIVPHIPLDQPAPDQRLMGVLQGLGITDALLLADPRWLRFAAALAGTDLVRGVCILLDSACINELKAATRLA